jgi:cytoplasmic iron level regulating protein YaaA (DUF328/UPF0246 family)
MKILFSPSEAKNSGGEDIKIDRKNYLFEELFDKRKEVLDRYNEYVLRSSEQELMKLFGTKKKDMIDHYKKDIYTLPTLKAVERYSGVAYEYLKYKSLNQKAREYIDKNCIIFSNLFGPIRAGDKGIPEYKQKQGEKIGDLATEKFYNVHFSKALDEYLGDMPLLDLRAGFYDKFYKPRSPYITLKFIKEGKVVSHWAKAYRGLVLKETAINDIKAVEDFMDMPIPNLSIKEILKRGIRTEVVYEIN